MAAGRPGWSPAARALAVLASGAGKFVLAASAAACAGRARAVAYGVVCIRRVLAELVDVFVDVAAFKTTDGVL
jgi:hypothetical protein